MQPLISPVDHESRHNNSYRGLDDEGQQSSERRPLLNHQFVRDMTDRRNTLTIVAVVVMLAVLISGVTIGIYLLVEQQRVEPSPLTYKLVGREEWDAGRPPPHGD